MYARIVLLDFILLQTEVVPPSKHPIRLFPRTVFGEQMAKTALSASTDTLNKLGNATLLSIEICFQEILDMI
jgi:hypothetical protein